MRNLKSLAIAMALACGMATSVQAQDTKHEIGISYGAGCNSTLFSFLEDLTTLTSTAGSIKYGDSKEFGTIAAEYFYHLSPNIGVGAIAGFAQSKKDLYILDKVEGDAKASFITVMPAVKIGWFDREHFGMYSKFAAGVTFRSEKQNCTGSEDISESDVMFNWQASLIGLEAGGKNLRGFAELGVGEQGIAVFGLRYKF